jgi:AraC-like DNA-binding protein
LPPRRSLIRRRAESACELLVNSSLTIAEISEKVGFNDPLYFSRSFHRETGMSASHYRLRYRTP